MKIYATKRLTNFLTPSLSFHINRYPKTGHSKISEKPHLNGVYRPPG